MREYLRSRQHLVDQTLDTLLPPKSTKPKTIHKAMRYSVFAGGKRLRPILCLAAAECCGGKVETALPLACALECIHTYSLIHDDLPCMDDDDFRRGRPTSHKVFGEGIAVLAGDALLTFAFEIAAQVPGWRRYSLREVIRELAIAAGSRHLIAGQVVDLESEGKKVSLPLLKFIHQSKTAALLRSSIRLGAMSANATPNQLRVLSDFGHALGLAFQVIDDILDVTQTSEKLGKSAGKDLSAEKATFPAVVGLERSRKVAKRLTAEARGALQPLGKKAEMLHGLADHLLQRDY
jgi:geranylgeranyl diphosphate synthase, type II